MRTIGIVCVSLLMIFSSACAFKLHTVEKNASLYDDPVDFNARAGKLVPDMTEAELFEIMKIHSETTAELSRLDANDVVLYVRGCIQPFLPAVGANDISHECALYSGWSLPYTSVRPNASFGLTLPEIFELIITTEGYDLKLVAVFRDQKLWKPFVSGRAVIGGKETYYIWDIFGEIVRGGATQGVKEAVKLF